MFGVVQSPSESDIGQLGVQRLHSSSTFFFFFFFLSACRVSNGLIHVRLRKARILKWGVIKANSSPNPRLSKSLKLSKSKSCSRTNVGVKKEARVLRRIPGGSGQDREPCWWLVRCSGS